MHSIVEEIKLDRNEPPPHWYQHHPTNPTERALTGSETLYRVFAGTMAGSLDTGEWTPNLDESLLNWKTNLADAVERVHSTRTVFLYIPYPSPGTTTAPSEWGIQPPEPEDLVEALLDLSDIPSEAEEDGSSIPDTAFIKRAAMVLRALYRADSRPYGAYCMPNGDIAIEALSPPGMSLTVMCEPAGSARCLWNKDGEFQHRTYDDMGILPDIFVRTALRKTPRRADA